MFLQPKPHAFALAALGLVCCTLPLKAINVTGAILIEPEATDFINGSDFWQQHQPGTGIPGGFVPRGSPTRRFVDGAPAILFDGDQSIDLTTPLTPGALNLDASNSGGHSTGRLDNI